MFRIADDTELTALGRRPVLENGFGFFVQCCLSSEMIEETLHHRETILVRRLVLLPGEATKWHSDPFHRVSVVLKGSALTIEFQDDGDRKWVKVTPGQVDWDEPGARIHRALNTGNLEYEEITVFSLPMQTMSHNQANKR